MYKLFNRTASIFIVMVMLFSCLSFFTFAEESTDILTFTVLEDGFVEVSACDSQAQGSVDVPASVEIGGKSYDVKYIGEKAFDSCYYITEINLPEGITSIKSRAFRDCLSLKEIYIPRSLIMCQYDAFEGCGNVTVHCYTTNYQFFTVFGMGSNLEIDILDPEEAEPEDNTDSVSFIDRFIEVLREMIARILELVGANEDEFEFDLGFDIPFIK